MTKYRIKKLDYGYTKTYVVQKKSFLGFWYNPDNVDAYTTGYYDTEKGAQECIARKLTTVKIRIITI